MRDGARLPRWFIIVRRDRPVLYEHLRDSYEGEDRVHVIVDRRRATPSEIAAGAEWRRVRDRQASPTGDRRRLLGHRGVLHGPPSDRSVGVIPPIWLDEARRPCPTYPCAVCGREKP